VYIGEYLYRKGWVVGNRVSSTLTQAKLVRRINLFTSMKCLVAMIIQFTDKLKVNSVYFVVAVYGNNTI